MKRRAAPPLVPPPLDGVAHIPTPALVVDVAAVRRNHAVAIDCLRPGQILRPHFKAHKCTALLRLQGMPPMCCQTSWEAIALANAGITDIMVTNQIVDAAALEELATAAGLARVSALVDDVAHVTALDAAATRAGVAIGAIVEIDTGMRRCGVPADSDALVAIVNAIGETRFLRFAGLQAYDGHVAAVADPLARREGAGRVTAVTERAIERLRAEGIAVEMVAGGSTGHMPFLGDLSLWTDIQAGSYLLMDGAYGAYEDLAFGQALFALATVIHRSPDRIVLDIGLKQLAVDRGNPSWIGDPSAALRLSDEHTVVATAVPAPLSVGDRTWIVPRHVDPTVNLNPLLWLWDGSTAEPAAIDGRLAARPARAPAGA